MQTITHKDAIDIGDTVYLFFPMSLRIGRKKQVVYSTHDALKVVSFFEHLSGDDEDPIITPCCKVKDSNGKVFDAQLNRLSLKPDDKAKRVSFYKGFALQVLAVIAFFAVIATIGYIRY